jgi:hypothetical protein
MDIAQPTGRSGKSARVRNLLYPFEIALLRAPGAPPEFRRCARSFDRAALALDQEYEDLRQQGISGELVLIDHDHRQTILQRRQLPSVDHDATHLPE